VAMFDDAGAVQERVEYDAYGTAHIMDASYNSRTVSSYDNPHYFTGRHLRNGASNGFVIRNCITIPPPSPAASNRL
jgi:hypothetical protein